MTIAIGGVMGRDPTLHAPVPRQSMASTSSPFRPITRPPAGTPSFARPTVASVTKTKRNIFGPSPSPAKSITPRKSGMEAAAEVAKRLSFGSNASASDSGKKRARSASFGDEYRSIGEAEKGQSPSKRRMLVVENVFTEEVISIQRTEVELQVEVQRVPSLELAPPPSPPSLPSPPSRQVQPESQPVFQARTPRKSLSAPSSRLSSMSSKSPAKSPMLRRMLGQVDQDEEDHVDADLAAEEGDAEFEPPTITLGSFLEMAGVQFIEALPAARRRSSVGRGVLGRTTDGELAESYICGLVAHSAGDRDFALHDYTAAQVNNVFLNMYSWVSFCSGCIQKGTS